MPTTFTHAFVGVSCAHMFSQHAPCLRFLAASLLAANLPDLDVLTLYLGYPDSHVLGHRGIMHSLPFACVAAPCWTMLFFGHEKFLSKRWLYLTIYFLMLIASHSLLDSLNDSGVAFWAPFVNDRYVFPIHTVVESPRIEDFMCSQSFYAIISEIQQIWGPLALGILGSQAYTDRLPGSEAWKEAITYLQRYYESARNTFWATSYGIRSFFL